MARFDTSGLNDLVKDMTKMGQRSGAMAEAMVKTAGMEIRDSWKRTAEKHKYRKTGAMIDSIGMPEGVQTIGDSSFVDIYPQGKDKNGTRNAEKAFILHYGTSRIRPSYWTDEADDASEPVVGEKLDNMWGKFLETGTVPIVADSDGQNE